MKRLSSLISLLLILTAIYGVSYSFERNDKLKPTSTGEIIGEKSVAEMQFGQFATTFTDNIWERENTFINYNLYKREGVGPRITTIDEYNKNVSEESIRILLLGDSFIWGDGVTDPNNSIAIKLQDSLNKRSKPGAFRVYILSRNGSSTYNYPDYMTEEVLKEINPDKIVYAHYMNDAIPNFNEKIICQDKTICENYSPESTSIYQNCIKGEEGLFPQLLRNSLRDRFPTLTKKLLLYYCDPILQNLKKNSYSQELLWNQPWDNPWLDKWYQSLEAIASKKKGDVYVAELRYLTLSPKVYQFNKEAFNSSGLKIIPMTKTIETVGKYDTRELQINPINNHSNAMLSQSYADDIANELIKNYNIEEIKSVDTKPFNLISSTLPSNLKLISNNENYSKATFTLDRDHGFDDLIAGKPLPRQFVSCAFLGKSYIQINLNRFLNGGTVKVKVNSAEKLTLGLFEYDKEYKKYHRVVKGDTITLNPMMNNYQLTLINEKDKNGCSVENEITFPSFTLEVFYEK